GRRRPLTVFWYRIWRVCRRRADWPACGFLLITNCGDAALPPGTPHDAHQPPAPRDEPLPPAARPQPGGLVPLGRGGAAAGARAGPADLPEHRLLGVPLVPRHGARELRGRGGGAAAQR